MWDDSFIILQADKSMMARKPLVLNINPALLVWARTSLGKSSSEVASELRVNEKKVQDWESGEEKISLSEMEKVARMYKRPLAAFFLPAPPKELPIPVDFRTLPEERRKPISSKTRLAFRKARRLQALYMELINREINGMALNLPRAALSDRPNPEELAERTRELLGISLEAQRNWRNEAVALNDWRNAVEKRGILVFQMSMPIEENRGFSLTDGGPSVIVLNLRDSAHGRIFSLFHELGHIILNKGGLCDMESREESLGENAGMEIFCNHFAGAVIVPKHDILNLDVVREKMGRAHFSDRELAYIARIFRVSREVALRRLVILGKASREQYRKKHEEWAAKGRKPQRGGKVDISKKCIQDKGVLFVSKVLSSHREGRITYNDVADYLGIRVKHMPKLEGLIKGKSSK